jgi:hypothetical protein
MQLQQYIPVFLALSVVISSSSAGPVYRWVDDGGVTCFSDTPPIDEFASVTLIEDLPPPAAGMPGDGDFYSVVNQARRMENQRLLAEKLKAERLQADAEARQARAEALAAQQPAIQYENEPDVYIYPYHPRHHRRPPGKHPPGDHKPGRLPRPEHFRSSINKLPALRGAAIPKSHRVRPD